MPWKVLAIAFALVASPLAGLPLATSDDEPAPVTPDETLTDPPDRDGPIPEQAPTPSSGDQPKDDVTRDQLEEGRVSHQVPQGSWAAYRLVLDRDTWNIDHWGPDGGEANLTLFLAADPGLQATPMIQVSIYHQGDQGYATVPFTLHEDRPTVQTLTVSAECSSNCGDSPGGQLAFVRGSMDGPSTFHLGIPTEPLPEDPQQALEAIEAREPIDDGPDGTGDGVASGLYAYGLADGEPTRLQLGHIEVDVDRTLQPGPLEVARQLSIDVDEPIEGDGTAQMLVGLREQLGTHAWSLEAQLPPRTTSGQGATTETPPADPNPTPLDTEQSVGLAPAAYLHVRPDAGQAVLDVDQTFTGTEGAGTLHLASWAWTSANLTDLYGWPHSDLVGTGGASTDDGFDLHAPSSSLCQTEVLASCVSVPTLWEA